MLEERFYKLIDFEGNPIEIRVGGQDYRSNIVRIYKLERMVGIAMNTRKEAILVADFIAAQLRRSEGCTFEEMRAALRSRGPSRG